MTGRRPAQHPPPGGIRRRGLFEGGDQHGGQRAEAQPREGPVGALQRRGRTVAVVVRQGAHGAAQLRHGRGRVDGVPGDVADDQQHRAVRLEEGVVEVPTDERVPARRPVADSDVEVVGARRRGQQTPLQRLGDLQLAAVEPGVVQRHPGSAGDLHSRLDLTRRQRGPAAGGDERQRTDGLAVDDQRHEQERAGGQPIPGGPDRLAGQRRTAERRMPAGQLHRLTVEEPHHHLRAVPGAAPATGEVDVEVLETRRVTVRARRPQRPAVVAEHGHRRPVGESRAPPAEPVGRPSCPCRDCGSSRR